MDFLIIDNLLLFFFWKNN